MQRKKKIYASCEKSTLEKWKAWYNALKKLLNFEFLKGALNLGSINLILKGFFPKRVDTVDVNALWKNTLHDSVELIKIWKMIDNCCNKEWRIWQDSPMFLAILHREKWLA